MAQILPFRQDRPLVLRVLVLGAVGSASVLLVAVALQATGFYRLGAVLDPGLVLEGVVPGAPLHAAGLRDGDMLASLEGVPLYTRNQFRFLCRLHRAGESVELTARHPDGSQGQYRIILAPSTGLATAVLVLFLVALGFLAIGALVFMLDPQEEASRVFLGACMALAFSYGAAYARNPWLGLLETTAFLVPSFVLHFFLVFPSRYRWVPHDWRILPLYLPGVVLCSIAVLTALAALRTDVVYIPYWAPSYQALGGGVGLGILIHRFVNAKRPLTRQQLKWIVWGIGTAVALNASFLILQRLRVLPASVASRVLDLANWSVLIVPVSFAFSIARYRLFDIDTVINRTIVYTLFTLITVLSYLLVIRFLMALDVSLGFADPLAVAVLVILLSVLLDPLRREIQGFVDRALYRRRPSYQQIQQQLSREMAASIDLEHLQRLLLGHLQAATQSERIQIFLLDLRGEQYRRSAAWGRVYGAGFVSMQSPLIQELQVAQEVLWMPESSSQNVPSLSLSSPQVPLREEQLLLAIPLRVRGTLIGWLGFGARDKAGLYSLDERRLLSSLADQAAIVIQNALLYRDSQERALQLSVLNRVGLILTSTLDLDELLERLLAELVDVFSVEAASILLLDAERKDLVFQVVRGGGGADLVGVRIPMSTRSIATFIVHTAEPVLSNEIQTDPRWYAEIDEKTGQTTRQLLGAPLSRRGEPVGVIELMNRLDGMPFTEDDLQLLTTVAAETAIVIHNAQLYASTDQALARRVEELSTMQEIDRQLNATLDFDRVLDLTLQWAMDRTAADAGAIALVVDEPGHSGLWIAAARGYPRPLEQYQQRTWPLGQGVIGKVAADSHTICIGDVRGAADYVPERKSTRSELAVPVVLERRVIGVLNLESDRLDSFGQEEQEFALRLADHAALSIANARLYGQVKRANDSKSEFVSLVSHELKAPMTVIKGYAELIELTLGDALETHQRGLLGTIIASVEHMQVLINDLLQLAHLESGRLELERCPISVHTALGEVLASFRGSIRERQLAVSLAISPDLPPAYADPVRLNQILTNLLSNAVKYTLPGGSIEVIVQARAESVPTQEGRTDAPYVCCMVRDSGIGISAQDQQKLFRRYFRADHPAVRRQPGTGLGLSITKVLVEMHGGRIWCESEEGKGSLFAFTVPTARQAPTLSGPHVEEG